MSSSYSDKERQLRSVFVGNIPFDVTEGELREKFEQAGPIVSFRLVHDRDSGKPKGYGFIEYQDAATANSCVRNLNNVEYNGRPLRVGPAAGGDQSSTENIKALQQALGGLQQESAHGPAVDPTEAPEAISKAVSSLPPEQMFELMKQMKLCIQNNPSEARSMLLQNPQLAYALLQAQIVMKIVDPQVAMALLHRDRENIPAVTPEDAPKPVIPASAAPDGYRGSSGGLLGERPSEPLLSPASRPPLLDSHGPAPDRWGGPGMDPRGAAHSMRTPEPLRDMDTRSRDPRGAPPNIDPRGGSRATQSVMDPRRLPPGLDSRGPLPGVDPRREPRGHPAMDSRGMPMERRDAMRSQDIDYRNMDRGRPGGEFGRGGGLLDAPDPRQSGPSRGGMPPNSQFSPRQGGHPSRPNPPASGAEEDKEKAALIMQVLQLTDEQIQQLPPDQRQSILILKEQISRQQ